jgi:hypothetical protein
MFDEMRGKGDWWATYDGRAIINDTYRDWQNGVSEKVLNEKYAVAEKESDYKRLVIYAGTGSGLVTKPQAAAEILDEIEERFAERVKAVNTHLGML